MDWDDKKVWAYKDHSYLVNPIFRVSQAGKNRVRREKRKNVHAGVLGESFASHPPVRDSDYNWFEVKYNPYKNDNFICIGKNVLTLKTKYIIFWKADIAYFDENGKVYAGWMKKK